MRTLKIGVQWLAIARWQQSIERIIETDPLATPGEFAEELSVSHSTVIMHLKQIGMVKSLINGCLISWPKKKKIIIFMCCLLLFCNSSEPFLDWIVIWDEKWILSDDQQPPTQWLNREEAPKYFPKPSLHQKKVTVTVWWSADVLSHCSFLNPDETITSEKYAQQIDDMLQMPTASLGQEKGSSSPWQWPTACCTTSASEVEWLGLWSFALYTILTWSLANWQPLLQASWQLFLQGKCFHNDQLAENAFQEFVESRSLDF